MSFVITACVLAIVVPLVVGIGLLTYVQNLRMTLAREQLATLSEVRDKSLTSLATLTERVARCESGIAQTSSTHVAAELAALAADVEKLATNQRKQFGKVWAELHHDGVLKRNEAAQQTVETPEETRARLRAEHGLPKMNRRPNGAED